MSAFQDILMIDIYNCDKKNIFDIYFRIIVSILQFSWFYKQIKTSNIQW